MSGTSRPSSSRCAFHCPNEHSSSPSSWPALREPDRLRRVEADAVLVPRDVPGDRDHELRFTPESGDDATPAADRGSSRSRRPSAGTGSTLKSSAASTIASSGSDSRRRIGSRRDRRLGRWTPRLEDRAEAAPAAAPRSGIVGVVGLPSLSQPYSTACSWQSGHTSTKLDARSARTGSPAHPSAACARRSRTSGLRSCCVMRMHGVRV